MKKSKDVLHKAFSLNLISLIIKSCIVGLLTGLLVSLFRWTIDQTLHYLQFIYPEMAHYPLLLIPYVIFMIVICVVLARIIKDYEIDLVGSGVPQIEAIINGKHSMNWIQILWRKFIGGLLAICPGLLLGREGPCIQMGAAIGQGISGIIKGKKEDQRTLLVCGIAAGLSAAFSAPLAGTMFLLEEIIFTFEPKICLTALTASISADTVTVIFFGTKPCLYLPVTRNLPVKSYPIIIILSIITGLLAYSYQYCLLDLRWYFNKIKILPARYHSIIPLLLIIPVGLYNPKLLGGSHLLINSITSQIRFHNINAVMIILLFYVIRFVFSMISYGSTVPGGIFMPILVLGSLWGNISAIVLIYFGLLPSTTFMNIIAITMAAYFGAVEMAPITSILLITEMVGSIEQILPMTIGVYISYIVIDNLGGRPIYTALREELF
ncbi:MAG: ClC family H(+)/Cl(-) exchange transporter [Limosilactobacillus coleohominis]|nr:ClC family H(+)/Cl(-) exchange transporter [Limosilactobacillus coleohominis]MCI5811980.1 ClC family H(+)/Cl(-) exchange transporter [Lactobacillus sp.]MCI6368311.1 ClC family H(+)/Cl(-) exchange transporter [Limosilactobacillus reuteri]MDY3702540.1 ClC family H(+)/Cl(-) exchange transporter [Limosilactobacillus coleohominis]